jgi:hypothetical protein
MSFDWNNALENEIAGGLGMVPEVGALLSALVYILWPKSQEDIWGEIKDQVEQLVDQKIANEVYQQVQEDLQGLQNVMGRYQQALQANDPNDIRTEWDNSDDAFVNALPHFQEQQYAVQLLPLFAQFANLHLALLRDGVQFGASWGWNAETQANHAANLTSAIASYTKWAQTTYELGKATTVVLAMTKDLTGIQHKVEPFQSSNRYLRQMTLTVVDFMQMWKYFDATVYPNPVKVYLDREIYSDAFGTADDSGPLALPQTPPTQPVSSITVWGQDRIESVQLTYPAGGGPNGATTTPRMGFHDGTGQDGSNRPPRGGIFGNVANNPVTSVIVGAGDIVNFLSFTFKDGTGSGKLGGGYPGGGPNTVAYSDHLMSSLYVSGSSAYYQCADCMVVGFKYDPDRASATKAACKAQYVAAPRARTTAELATATVTQPVTEPELSAMAAAEGWDQERAEYQAFVASKVGALAK